MESTFPYFSGTMTFEADANTLTLIGDGAIKLNQAIPGYIDKDLIRDLTGIKGGNVPASTIAGATVGDTNLSFQARVGDNNDR